MAQLNSKLNDEALPERDSDFPVCTWCHVFPTQFSISLYAVVVLYVKDLSLPSDPGVLQSALCWLGLQRSVVFRSDASKSLEL